MFYDHEPWGYEIEEQRHAQALVTAINCVPRKKGTKPLDWRQFCPSTWTEDTGDSRFTPEQLAFIQKRKAQQKQGSKRRLSGHSRHSRN